MNILQRLYDYLNYALPEFGFLSGGNHDTARLHEKPNPVISLPSYEPLFSTTELPVIEQNVIKIIEVPTMNPVTILISKLEALLISNDDGEEMNRRIESSVFQTHSNRYRQSALILCCIKIAIWDHCRYLRIFHNDELSLV